MSIPNILKKIITYQEPKQYDKFELLEDEPIEVGESASQHSRKQSSVGAQGGSVQPANSQSGNGQAHNEQPKNEPPQNKQTSEEQKPKGFFGKVASKLQNKPENNDEVHAKLQLNIDKVKSEFNAPINQDVVIREFKVAEQYDAFIVYIDGMADKNTINDYVLRQLMEQRAVDKNAKGDMAEYIKNNLLPTNQIKIEDQYPSIVKQVLNGLTALFVEGSARCILIETRGYEKRSINAPQNETVVQGPHEAFIENLRTNITLVRRIVRNQNLITEMMPACKSNNATCALLYLEGVTNPNIVREVKRRIASLDIEFTAADDIMNQLIEDHPFAIFPQILSTERPDRAASLLMEGKVVIMCDGSPFASAVPITFFHLMYTSEDYALRWQYGTFQRIIRFLAMFTALFLPGLYLALTLYHQEMIPSDLLTTLAKARENLPFPLIVELLSMEFAWELIREASIRVPGTIGNTLGIVGAIVLGQAAVAAGLVSPILIIIVAITGLGSFAIPNFQLQYGIRMLRFAFIFLGAIAGFYGIAAGVFIFGGLACSMKSFGMPFFAPIAPKTKSIRDVILRMPAWLHTERPDALNTLNRSMGGNPVRGWVHQNKREEKQ